MKIEIKPLDIPQVHYDPLSQEWIRDKAMAQLHAWFMENKPGETMRYKEAAERQIMFLRDELQNFFNPFVLKKVQVISTHTSKSIKLPVYYVELEDGMQLILRGNFHDWKISVNSPFDVEIPEELLSGVVLRGEKIHSCYCEGFKEEWIWDSYLNNKKKFTIEIGASLYELYTFFFLLSVQVNKESKAIEAL